ncbi:MAG: response regulator [Spirochaetales bacterium]|nr:MAG: response regulator [Spirochaetales bacterium]
MAQAKNILIIDDDPDFIEVVKKNLEKEGFKVESALDGIQGMEKIKKNPPDAVILDVMMPGRDGYEVCADLKADPKYASIPVILLTAVASHVPSTRYTHYNGMSMEADDYFPKPASAEQILKSIKRLLDL